MTNWKVEIIFMSTSDETLIQGSDMVLRNKFPNFPRFLHQKRYVFPDFLVKYLYFPLFF